MKSPGGETRGNWGTDKFPIYAADGSYVSTVPAGIDRVSNILPQSVGSGVWPVSMAAGVGHYTTSGSATTTSSVEPASTAISSSIAVETSSASSSASSAELSSSSEITSSSNAATTPAITSAAVTSIATTAWTTFSSSSAAPFYPAGNSTTAANGTSAGLAGPTSTGDFYTGAASSLNVGMGAAGFFLVVLGLVL